MIQPISDLGITKQNRVVANVTCLSNDAVWWVAYESGLASYGALYQSDIDPRLFEFHCFPNYSLDQIINHLCAYYYLPEPDDIREPVAKATWPEKLKRLWQILTKD